MFCDFFCTPSVFFLIVMGDGKNGTFNLISQVLFKKIVGFIMLIVIPKNSNLFLFVYDLLR